MNALVRPRRALDFGIRAWDFPFWLRALLSSLVLAAAFQPAPLQACAACYGQSDSPMAKGMNWGIFSLLAVIVIVLGGVAAFFVFLAHRAAAVSAEPATQPLLASASAVWPRPGRAPVLGRSDVRGRWGFGTLRPVRQVGACGAQGRAHPGPAALGGGARKLPPESTDSVL
jgi:hypothetical protein